MNDVLQPTQSKTPSKKSTVQTSTSSSKSNPSTTTLSTASLSSSLVRVTHYDRLPSQKSRFANENKISAPAGREIINTSRRKIYIGRAGAGNAMPSESTPERQQKVREIIERDREVLSKYKAQDPVHYTTGRGGAGAKGHVKHKGKVPNHERALAKERDIQAKWKEDKERSVHLRTGRGGRGNILRASQITVATNAEDDASTSSTRQPRADSILANWAQQERPMSAFGTTASEQARRRRFSLTHNSGSRSNSSDYRPSSSQDFSRAPSSATNNWDNISDADSMYDLEVSTGIVTSTVDPSTILGSLGMKSGTANSSTGRIPNQIAPFQEPHVPPARGKRLSLQIGPRVPKDGASPSTPTGSTSSQLLRPFKKLQLGKPIEARGAPSNDVLDISATAGLHEHESTSINITTTVHQQTADQTAASAALQMIDPSNRNFMPPSRIVSPPPIPTPQLPFPERRYSYPYPYTFNIDELRGDDDDATTIITYDDGNISRRTSGTFGFMNTDGSFISTSPSTPTATSSPPTLPVLFFQEPVPPRREDISWKKRRLPVPPVEAHSVLRPASADSGLLSPPQTPKGTKFMSSQTATPMPKMS